MYKNLTSKEKKKKLNQARKRAITWSAQEQICKALKKQSLTNKKSESPKEASTLKKPASATIKLERESLANIGITNQSTTVPTISDIENTLHNLLQQRDNLNITISVLSAQLHRLKLQEQAEDEYEFE